MSKMMLNTTSYLRHYVNLESTYADSNAIYDKFTTELKLRIRNRARDGGYKFQMYLKLNPQLEKSPYLHHETNDTITTDITKFRLGSHRFPIETGRWSRKPRDERMCVVCNEVGDELHCVYECSLVNRDGIVVPENFNWDWNDPNIMKLFKEIKIT